MAGRSYALVQFSNGDLALIVDGWCSDAKKLSSSNADERPKVEVSLLVIHNISLPPGKYGGRYIEDFFLNQLDYSAHPYFRSLEKLHVSSHCLIKRSGALTQFVSFDRRAWHAGKSSFDGVDRCNDYSIGIELEGTDTQAYTEAQYQSLVDLSVELMACYPLISAERIVGHCDIAPSRKTDPGAAFDWDRFKQMLEKAK